MKKYMIMLLVGTLGLSNGVIISQFVVPKKQTQKNLSRGALQESCCQEMGDMLQLIPPVLTALADAQTESLKQLCGFLQNDKTCFLQRADKEQLAVLEQKMKKLTAYLKEVNVQLAQQVQDLRQVSFNKIL